MAKSGKEPQRVVKSSKEAPKVAKSSREWQGAGGLRSVVSDALLGYSFASLGCPLHTQAFAWHERP